VYAQSYVIVLGKHGKDRQIKFESKELFGIMD